MMSFENFQYHESALPQDENEQKEYFEKLIIKFQEEVSNSSVAQKYFQQYKASAINSFIKSYAEQKVKLIKRRSFFAGNYQEKEDHDLYFQHMAEEMLKVIMQKKLFNLELLWRAGKVKVKEVNSSYDFGFWQRYPDSCPFMPVIEKAEIKAMKEYLLIESDDNWVYHLAGNFYLSYSELMKKDNDGDRANMPEWFDFYDRKLDTGGLLYLPDIKGEIEQHYIDLYALELSKNREKKPVSPIETDDRPYIYGLEEECIDFARHFETDKYFVELFKYLDYYVDQRRNGVDEIQLHEAVNFLALADRPVYIPGHLVWDKAIVAAMKKYTNTRVVEILDFVYDNYLTLKELGIARGRSKTEMQEKYKDDLLVNHFGSAILQGRRLNGEPEDFNY